MTNQFLFCSALLVFSPLIAAAAPVLLVGSPGNSQLSTPTGPSQQLGNLINFDSLTPFSTFAAGTYAARGVSSISSPDGLEVLPYSTQSSSNELYDESAAGTANISILLASGTTAIGIGIADSDPVSVIFQALNAAGTPFGPVFTENLAITQSTVNTGNGYYVISDTTNDIFGLKITQNTANANFSGLAIDDLQTAPEPSSFALLLGAATVFFCAGLRKRA